MATVNNVVKTRLCSEILWGIKGPSPRMMNENGVGMVPATVRKGLGDAGEVEELVAVMVRKPEKLKNKKSGEHTSGSWPRSQ